jgi:coenzyme F420-reducing hydrogenase beta subunit
MSEVVARMNSREDERRYCVVGLPCFLKGLHLAMELMPRLRRRVIYTMGLTCGHLPNRFYTEYLIRLSGLDPEDVCLTDYRRKVNTNRAGNYQFRAITDDGRVGKDIPFSRISNIWIDGYFQINACNYCDDIFAELGDISFMDAWLPEYERDPKGYSMMVVRHPDLAEILLKGKKRNTCHLFSIPKQKILQSQKGGVHNKRTVLAGRLFRAKIKSIRVPHKRIDPDGNIFKKFRWQIETRYKIQRSSKTNWQRTKGKNMVEFQRSFLLLSIPLIFSRLSARVFRVLKHPSKLFLLFKR